MIRDDNDDDDDDSGDDDDDDDDDDRDDNDDDDIDNDNAFSASPGVEGLPDDAEDARLRVGEAQVQPLQLHAPATLRARRGAHPTAATATR